MKLTILSKHTQFTFFPFTHTKTGALIHLFNYSKKTSWL